MLLRCRSRRLADAFLGFRRTERSRYRGKGALIRSPTNYPLKKEARGSREDKLLDYKGGNRLDSR